AHVHSSHAYSPSHHALPASRSFPTRRSSDLQLADADFDCLLEPGDQAAVLGDVVGRDADRLAARVEHVSILALEHVAVRGRAWRSEEHTSELQSLRHLVCRLLLEKKKKT